MKIFLCLLTLILTLVPVPTIAAQDGYSKTVQWWQSVRQMMVPYELQLQQMYADVEASPGMRPNKVRQEFNRLLASEYPGSAYHGSSGYLKTNNYTTLYFSQDWKINRLIQQIVETNKSYDFRQHTLNLTRGSNRINFKLDLRKPENSKFTLAALPAITATVSDIYQTRPGAVSYLDGMSVIIEDVYRFNIATFTGKRMDQFAEQLITDVSSRENVLSQARQLYQNPPQELLASSKGGSLLKNITARPAGGLPSGTGVLKGAFDTIPWFVFIAIFAFISMNVFTMTKRVKRYSKRFSLFEELVYSIFSGRAKKYAGNNDEGSYESQGHLNSAAEQKFQGVLEGVLDQELYTLNGKTRLADVLKVKGYTDYGQGRSAFNRIKSKHVDFVITEKRSSRIVGVIELDDRSHQRPDRRKRDQQVDQWLTNAGIPILHYPCRREYSFVELQRALSEVFGISPQPFGDFTLHA